MFSTINILNYLVFAFGWYWLVSHADLMAAGIGLILIIFNVCVTRHYSIRIVLSLLLVAFVGYLNDLLLAYLGVFTFKHGIQNSFWLLVLWGLFVTTFQFSFYFYRKLNYLIQSILSGLGGTLTYFSASKLGALQYMLPLDRALPIHFLNWSILMPIIYSLYLFLIRDNHA